MQSMSTLTKAVPYAIEFGIPDGDGFKDKMELHEHPEGLHFLILSRDKIEGVVHYMVKVTSDHVNGVLSYQIDYINETFTNQAEGLVLSDDLIAKGYVLSGVAHRFFHTNLNRKTPDPEQHENLDWLRKPKPQVPKLVTALMGRLKGA